MAKYIVAAPSYGATVDQITRDKNYPAAEVAQYLNDPDIAAEPDIFEEQALRSVEAAIDVSNVKRIGEGEGVVYAYGYACSPDRLKVGSQELDTGAADRGTDRNEHARQARSTLEARECKISGGGAEWFKTSQDEVVARSGSV